MKRAIQKFLRKFGYEIHRYQNAFGDQQKLLTGIDAPVIFDAGAHHGYMSTFYRNLFPKASIYAFEPFPESFDVLQKRTASFCNIRANNLALSNRSGMAEFHVNCSSATNSLLPTSPAASQIWGEGVLETRDTIRVETTTLDEFGGKNKIERINLLKLDVQGAEPLVLEGARHYCENGNIDVIYTEIITMPSYTGRMELYEFLAMLHKSGFHLYNFYNFFMHSGRLKQMDAIFVRDGFNEE